MKKQQVLTLTLSLIALFFLTSCGPTKSNQALENSSLATLPPPQPLANCNNVNTTSLNFSLASVIEATTGQVNMDWIKLKFNFLSVDLTQTNYTLKFFKWRIINNSAQLDPNPLVFTVFTLATGKSSSEVRSSLPATQVSKLNGFHIRLNDDPQYPYQVLKVVIYKNDGSIAKESDILIPQFLASPLDYKLNRDGSPRAENLLKLHPLNTVDIANWSQAQLVQTFDQHCF